MSDTTIKEDEFDEFFLRTNGSATEKSRKSGPVIVIEHSTE